MQDLRSVPSIDSGIALAPLPPEGRRFADARHAAVERLVRAGIRQRHAQAWIEIWDASTAGLNDFRHAPDFWDLGVRYALEEYRRGYRPAL